MIDTAITSLLEGVAGVDTRVSPAAETINVGAGLPRVAYTLVDELRNYNDDGKDNLMRSRYQVDVFADLPSDARAVGAKIQAPADAVDPEVPGLDGYRGTVWNTRIERISFDGGAIQPGIKIEGKDKTIARYLFDMLVDHRG